MKVTPEIQVSHNGQQWFSIFKPSEMLIFSALFANLEMSETVGFNLYVRIAPDNKVQDYTPAMVIEISKRRGGNKPGGQA